MDTGINENVVPDSLVLHDPITGEPIQKQYDESSIVLDPLTEKQIADQEHMLEMQRLMAQQKTAGYTGYNAMTPNMAGGVDPSLDKNKETSRTLCFLSLAGLLISHFWVYFYFFIIQNLSPAWIFGVPALGSLCGIAGFILMIVARVKSPKYVFSKVVMWIYIVLISLRVLGVLLIWYIFMIM